MDEINIRPASAEDNAALVALCHDAPMRGVLTAYVDREPDFFAFSRLQGENVRVWAAEKQGELVCCAAHAEKDVRYNGRKVRLIYGGDLKVKSTVRRAQIGLRMSQHVAELALSSQAELGEGTVIEGNTPPIKILERITEGVEWIDAGTAVLYQVLPYRRYPESADYRIRRAEQADIPAIATVLAQCYESYDAAPLFDEEWLRRETGKSASFTIGDFRVAEKDGRIVAVAAFWDQEPIRRTVIVKFSRATRLLVGVLRLLRPLLGFPKPPRPGDSLRYVFLRYPAALPGAIEGLRAILHAESNALRRRGLHQFIWASFHQADPLVAAISRMWKIKGMRVTMFFFSLRDYLQLPTAAEAAQRPTYVDFSLI